MSSLSRRDFVVGCSALVALCGVGGISLVSADRGGIVRPPGGQDESAFLSACLKCDRCRSVCPQGCIGIAHVEDGLLEARTPKMDFKTGACDFCNLCVEVCPTGALSAIDPYSEKIGLAVVVPSTCVAWSNPGSCRKCVEACPFEAVSIEGGVPQVDVDACNGCGACEMACPALVYTSTQDRSERGIVVRTVEAAYAEQEQER